MKIGMQTWGSDGDILPFMALAHGLQGAGHQVTIAYTSVDNKDYAAYAAAGGFVAVRAYGDFASGPNAVLEEIVRTNDPMKQFVLVMQQYFDPALEEMYAASQALCADNDIVIGHMVNHTLLTAAEISGRSRVSVALAPLAVRTSEIPLFGPHLGRFINSLTWKLGDYVGRKKMFSRAEALRRREGLPPLKSMQEQLYISKDLTLIASSPALSPRRGDWGEHIQICGDLHYPPDDHPIPLPPGLQAFLQAGPPPVYMTFGSLTQFQTESFDTLMAEAASLAGCRAIIQSDWPGKMSPDIFRCARAPHAQVFPQCAAIVHHGGAGTSHSAARSGRPSIVVEHAFDQQFWGDELRRAGVAGAVLHRNTVTADQLAQAIRTTRESHAMQQRAAEIGRAMQREDGVARAIQLIEQRFGR
ncbi:MAG TPA: glycosyltransferase [Oxalicibacterium sp.]|nr:glycosyltransferase [Oxalicibacterium sp.]